MSDLPPNMKKLNERIIDYLKNKEGIVFTIAVLALITLAVVAIILLIMTPLFLVWAINTLFNLSIAFTFKNWLAMAILLSVASQFGSNRSTNRASSFCISCNSYNRRPISSFGNFFRIRAIIL